MKKKENQKKKKCRRKKKRKKRKKTKPMQSRRKHIRYWQTRMIPTGGGQIAGALAAQAKGAMQQSVQRATDTVQQANAQLTTASQKIAQPAAAATAAAATAAAATAAAVPSNLVKETLLQKKAGVVDQVSQIVSTINQLNVMKTKDPRIRAAVDELQQGMSDFVKKTLCIAAKTFFNTCDNFLAMIPIIGIPWDFDKVRKDFSASFRSVSNALNEASGTVTAFSAKMKSLDNPIANLPQATAAAAASAASVPPPQVGGRRRSRVQVHLDRFFLKIK
jgi:hypothetical protein